MVKWVARLAILAALLGVAGTMAIIIHLHKNDGSVKQDPQVKPAVENHVIVDTPKIEAKRTLPATINKRAVILRKEDTTAFSPIKKAGEKQVTKPPLPETAEKKKDVEKTDQPKNPEKRAKVKKDEQEKLFTQEELQQLVNDINTAKEQNNIQSNCVQIFATEQSSNTRTIEQVEIYLRSNRFAIAGREVISKKVKGIRITPAGGCIRIIIGSL